MMSDFYSRDTLRNADRLCESLLAEASLLESLGSPTATKLREVACELSINSLDRIERGS